MKKRNYPSLNCFLMSFCSLDGTYTLQAFCISVPIFSHFEPGNAKLWYVKYGCRDGDLALQWAFSYKAQG